MEPSLVPGDMCLVFKDDTVRPGDVVLYRRPGEGAVLHRVVSVLRDHSVVMKGDANPVPDREAVPAAAVVGRVVFVLPTGAAVRGWMQATVGATLLNLPQ